MGVGGGHLDHVHCLMPGFRAQGGSSDGDCTLGKAGRIGRGYPWTWKRREPGSLGLGRPVSVKALENNAFGRNTRKGLYIGGCPSIGSRCHMVGQEGEEETAASQWPLVRCIYNRAQC